MSARYCKNMRCSGARTGKPCSAASSCDMFLWDIEKEKGNKPTSDLNGAIPLEAQEQEEFAAWCDAKGRGLENYVYTVKEIKTDYESGDDEVHCFDITIKSGSYEARFYCFAVVDDGEVMFVDCDVWR